MERGKELRCNGLRCVVFFFVKDLQLGFVGVIKLQTKTNTRPHL